MEKNHVVFIRLIDNTIYLSANELCMFKDEEVKFVRRDRPGEEDRRQFLVTFPEDKCPLAHNEIGHSNRVPCRPGVRKGTYKYTVQVGDRTLDPTIVIQDPGNGG
jgi:hypothetical protein